MKILIRLISLTLFYFIIIGLCVKQINPDSSISIEIVRFVPLVIILNLIIAVILFFKKKRINLLIGYQNERYESWKFKIKDKTYDITHNKLENTFNISASTNPGSSTVFLEVQFIKKENTWNLTTDSTEYIIKNQYVYQFRNGWYTIN